MSAWRRDALKALPELRGVIDGSWSPMSMWIEIHMAFEEAYRAMPRGEGLIKRIYALAIAGSRSKSPEIQQAVACAFLEHLPLNGRAWSEMHNHIPADVFQAIEPALKYHVSAAEFEERKSAYLGRIQAKKRSRGRPKQQAG